MIGGILYAQVQSSLFPQFPPADYHYPTELLCPVFAHIMFMLFVHLLLRRYLRRTALDGSLAFAENRGETGNER